MVFAFYLCKTPTMAFMAIVWKPNVTVAAVVYQNDRFLLVEEDTRDGIRYNNPAGHLDRGESLVQAVVRETREETAYRFTPTAWLGAYMSRAIVTGSGEDITYLRFAFLGQVDYHYPNQALDEGIVRAVWMSLEEVRGLQHLHRSPLVMKCIEDSLAGQRLPLEAVFTHDSVWLGDR
jgi:8-oxo-dGTP pyrophosphatase MutT (NUDIX family)